jgi:hypothetical protein
VLFHATNYDFLGLSHPSQNNSKKVNMDRIVKASIGLLVVLGFFFPLPSSAADPSKLVDFAHLGKPLVLKQLSAKENALLKSLGIDEDSGGIEGTRSRVVAMAGAKGLFVVSATCNSAADGSEYTCEFDHIVSLDSGRAFKLFGDQPIFLLIENSSSRIAETRFLENAKREVVSLLYVRTNAKQFKGKRTCDNRGAIIDLDAPGLKLVLREKRALGSECATKREQDDPLASGKFFSRLVDKLIAN